MPGPTPIPSALKLIQGNPGRRPISTREPQPRRTAVPAPPVWLDGAALEEWNRLAGALHQMGCLTEVDVMALAGCCQMYKRWRDAEEVLEVMKSGDPISRGIVVRTREGNIINNPVAGAANTLWREYLAAAREFGLTPASRTRIQTDGAAEDDAVGQKYFTG